MRKRASNATLRADIVPNRPQPLEVISVKCRLDIETNVGRRSICMRHIDSASGDGHATRDDPVLSAEARSQYGRHFDRLLRRTNLQNPRRRVIFTGVYSFDELSSSSTHRSRNLCLRFMTENNNISPGVAARSSIMDLRRGNTVPRRRTTSGYCGLPGRRSP